MQSKLAPPTSGTLIETNIVKVECCRKDLSTKQIHRKVNILKNIVYTSFYNLDRIIINSKV